jgi:hypothetical protein
MSYEIGQEIANSPLSLEDKLSWQLTANHYPPVGNEFIPIATLAILHAKDNDWDTVLEFPNGLQRTVSFVVEGLHLQPFIDGMSIPKEDN